MHSFDHVLNWQLQRGTHLFPGPDGGTCINEAALVAAGFPYQAISAARQMPTCFSRPICEYAMWLNDMASDEERQRLLPYVTRLACADTPEVERLRAAFIEQQTRGFYWPVTFDRGLQILDGALSIGRQADPFPADEVQARMEAIKRKAPVVVQTARTAAPEPATTSSVLTKGKNWFTPKVTT